jgi:hypothetical protein
MPSVRVSNVAAGTANAMNGLQFEDIPPGGALLSLYASAAVAGGLISLKVGSEDFLVDAEVNTEQNADEVNTDFDQILFQEPVPEGKLFIPVAAQVVNFLLVLEYVAA